MKKSAVRFLILTGLFELALCVPTGWNILVNQKSTWSEARKYCRDHHTDLSSVSSENEVNKLLNLQGSYSSVWIGLYKDDNDAWKWSGGKNASYFIWSGLKNTSGRCVAQSDTGWHQLNCETNKLDFCCFQSNIVLVKENVTWEEAMKQCRDRQSNLASVLSESRLVKILQTSRKAQTGHMWIGLRYLADGWLWVNGDTIKYNGWSQRKEPQCPAWSHHCGALSLEGHHWDSWDCTDKLNFVCK